MLKDTIVRTTCLLSNKAINNECLFQFTEANFFAKCAKNFYANYVVEVKVEKFIWNCSCRMHCWLYDVYGIWTSFLHSLRSFWLLPFRHQLLQLVLCVVNTHSYAELKTITLFITYL